jgi:uncharacterized repeat protein (TIGR03803 family)
MQDLQTVVLWLAGALAAASSGQAQAASESVLHNFGTLSTGASPSAGVVRDSAGNLYGTTVYGGPANFGVVYKLDSTGNQTVLYAFTGGADGGNPSSGVIIDSDGNLYGTTAYGGAAGSGVVYELDSTGHETVLYSFTGGTDGGYPIDGVIRDSAGNLYGATGSGGATNVGVVYEIDTTNRETVLYSFTEGPDGGYPSSGVIRDSAGNLYGTTSKGGSPKYGVVYKLDTTGQETALYSFTGGNDGRGPGGGLIQDSSGNLYGAAGGGKANLGVIYEVSTSGQQTVLFTFLPKTGTGGPNGGLVRDSVGNFYGTTFGTGPNEPTGGRGTVYKLDTAGVETTLYTFTGGADGGSPMAGVIRDSEGNLYGTTYYGGMANVGTVFMLNSAGQETVLYPFRGAADGSIPDAGVIRDSAGNLYGVTAGGGPANAGVVYELSTAGVETTLYNFTGGDGGEYPTTNLVRDSAGNLYGVTSSGGTSNSGTIFMLNTSGQQTVLYSFTGGSDGGTPNSIVRDSAGNLYGTTAGGGNFGNGVVFEVDSAGTESTLYAFSGSFDGGRPNGVVLDSTGNFYGTAQGGGSGPNPAGVVFKLDPAGTETVLYSFSYGRHDAGSPGGSEPHAGVILDSAGNLYGTTYEGGVGNNGVVYKLDTTGTETALYTFTGGSDGANPTTPVVRDSAGNLYGSTSAVYKLDTAGKFTVLFNFAPGGSAGTLPVSGVVLDPAGNLYGTTQAGGTANSGVAFKITR